MRNRKNTPEKLRKALPCPYSVCTSLWSKARGLMFKSTVERPLVFVFSREKRHSLHMLFVFCSIDVLFLDKSKRVVDIKENFKPFTFYTPRKACTYIIELPAGTIKRTKTSVGDSIEF